MTHKTDANYARSLEKYMVANYDAWDSGRHAPKTCCAVNIICSADCLLRCLQTASAHAACQHASHRPIACRGELAALVNDT